MTCFVPFNNRNLDISFFVFRPTVVLVDELVEAIKHFSLCTESLGCVHSAIFKSIHGNMIVWYGAWIKRTNENKELLSAGLLSMLTNVSSMAILTEHSFFDAYAGESKDGSPAAKFSTGDIVSLNTAFLDPYDMKETSISYACLALFKAYFLKMEGTASGVCFKGRLGILGLLVWKSLHSCYSWILSTDYRKILLPYFDHCSPDLKYDIFRVVYVSGDNVINFQLCPPPQMLENGVESKGG
ncbi:hypothetical protein F0562_013689 [Nyssa sinensis]|uniref:DUF7392 domain-containing protein n=1 Tax=Nyssa sinensis TaxID=561372 RepID=A0A5J4ZNY6_9ASTE|nr:hypothetical protein F0562_013689 [Nyssa sinensis]